MPGSIGVVGRSAASCWKFIITGDHRCVRAFDSRPCYLASCTALSPGCSSDEGQPAKMDSGAMPSGKMDGGAMDKGKMDGGAMDKGKMDGGAMDKGKMDGGAMDKGKMDGGAMDKGKMDDGAMHKGKMDSPSKN